MVVPTSVLSRYRPLARLGSGGMAEVYLVVAEGPSGFNKLQVLKVMRADLPAEERPDFLRMFQDEARLGARLNHPNIVQSHEVSLEHAQPFLVMEYLDGQSFGRVLERERKSRTSHFPLEMRLFVLCEVLEGLEYAHTLHDYDGTPLQIVHRDISPENVFVTYTGQVKVVDFGIAKSLESNKTRAGVVKGKVAYMAPEQVLSTGLDGRADLFSVGVMLWEAIAGRRMHSDLTMYETFNRVARGELPSIREAAPGIAPQLAEVVERALALDRAQRFPDAATFRGELLAVLDQLGKVRPRQVGERVAQMFATERDAISTTIRHAMTGTASSEELLRLRMDTVVTPLPGTPPGTVWSTPHTAHSDGPMHTSEHDAGQAAPTLPAPRRRVRKGLAALLLVGAGAALAVGMNVWEEPAEPPASVLMQVQTSPANAVVVLDGKRLENPHRAEHPSDAQSHELVVEAQGYRASRQSVRFESPLDLRIDLTPLPSASAADEVTAEPESRPQAPTPLVEPAAQPPVARSARARASDERTRRLERSEEYRDLPAPTLRTKPPAPALDKDDPWTP